MSYTELTARLTPEERAEAARALLAELSGTNAAAPVSAGDGAADASAPRTAEAARAERKLLLRRMEELAAAASAPAVRPDTEAGEPAGGAQEAALPAGQASAPANGRRFAVPGPDGGRALRLSALRTESAAPMPDLEAVSEAVRREARRSDPIFERY